MADPLDVADELREEAHEIRRLASAMHKLDAPLAVRVDGVLMKLTRLSQCYLIDEACLLESDAQKLETLYT